MARTLLFIFFSSAIFVLDRCVKVYVNVNIAPMNMGFPFYPYGGIGVFQNWCGGIDFSINHVTNTGAAWGIFSNFDQLLLILRVALIIGIAAYLLFFNKAREKQLPFAFILTGAAGNVVDHFFYGHVIDMFHFTFWGFSFAVFNIADAAIFCGVMFLLLAPAFEKGRKSLRNLLKRS